MADEARQAGKTQCPAVTTGEWQVGDAMSEMEGFEVFVTSSEAKVGSKLPAIACGRTKDEALANAHLVSAAKELYQALKDFDESSHYVSYDYTNSPFEDEVKAALAKARGE